MDMAQSGMAWSLLSCGRFTVTWIGLRLLDVDHLTNRSSQPLAVAMRTFDFYGTVSEVCHARRHQRWLSSFSLDVVRFRPEFVHAVLSHFVWRVLLFLFL